jgi:hypothetical protein
MTCVVTVRLAQLMPEPIRLLFFDFVEQALSLALGCAKCCDSLLFESVCREGRV